eukprot:304131-Rhodomonas_salina.4
MIVAELRSSSTGSPAMTRRYWVPGTGTSDGHSRRARPGTILPAVVYYVSHATRALLLYVRYPAMHLVRDLRYSHTYPATHSLHICPAAQSAAVPCSSYAMSGIDI